MFDFLRGCGICGSGGWFNDLQNLVAVLFALAAAVGAYRAGQNQAKVKQRCCRSNHSNQGADRKRCISIAADAFLTCHWQVDAVEIAVKTFNTYDGEQTMRGAINWL